MPDQLEELVEDIAKGFALAFGFVAGVILFTPDVRKPKREVRLYISQEDKQHMPSPNAPALQAGLFYSIVAVAFLNGSPDAGATFSHVSINATGLPDGALASQADGSYTLDLANVSEGSSVSFTGSVGVNWSDGVQTESPVDPITVTIQAGSPPPPVRTVGLAFTQVQRPAGSPGAPEAPAPIQNPTPPPTAPIG